MKRNKEQILIGLVAVLAGGIFLFWLLFNPVGNFVAAVPGMDKRPGNAGSESDSIIIGEKFQAFDSTYQSDLTGKWPNFRGTEGDNIHKEPIKLIDRWPESGPKIF
jgi:hypothetical protein